MELRAYFTILRRRWLLALIPAAVVLALGLLTYSPPAPAFNVGVNFIVGQAPVPGADRVDEQRYYNWLTSEYIVNGLVDWVKSSSFAAAVSAQLAAAGGDIPAAAVRGSLAADNARSVMTVSVTGGDAASVAAIMDAVIVVLIEQNATALPQLGGQPVVVRQLDEPVVNPVPAGLRNQLDLALRLALAASAGVGLAFLAEYLDPTLRSRQQLEMINLPVLGEIPRR